MIRIYSRFLRPYAGKTIAVILMTALTTFCSLLLPMLSKQIINKGAIGKNTGLIVQSMGIMLVVAVMSILIALLSNRISSGVSTGFARDIRSAFFAHVSELSQGDINKIGASSLFGRQTNDIQQMQTMLMQLMQMFLVAPIMVVGGIVMAAMTAHEMIWMLLVMIPFAIVIMAAIMLRVAPIFKQTQRKLDTVNHVIRENLNGMRVIRAFNREEYEREHFNEANDAYRRLAERGNKLMNCANPLMSVLINAINLLVIWFGSHYMDQGRVSYGDIQAFVQYVGMILSAFMANANPNRSQRFMIDKDGMRLLEDNHFANMGAAETLSDFFRFCEKTAPADHKIAVLWDHGAGAFGFASDDLYGGDSLTLKEVREAFDDVYTYDPKNPAFEIVGFDTCLMASLEVAETLHGYGRYLAASEEVEPGEGWDYTSWLNLLNENPALNGAQVGKAIADSFIDYYAKRSVQLEPFGVNFGVTFSVLDINAAHEVYGHYCDLADVLLRDAINDMDSLVTLARAANRTVRYGTSAYDIFNMIDLSTMIENLSDEYPAQTKAIMDDIDRAVVYNRASKSMSGSKGISVYFPAEIPNLTSLVYYLDYIENICLDESIRALYYYKASGCLNDEMQAYADSLGYGKAQKLDNTALRNLQYGDIAIDSDQFFVTLPESSKSLIQANTFQLFMLLDDYTVNFGEDELVKAEDGKLVSTFDGGWLFMEGNILPLERLGDSAGTIKYRTRVEHNGTDSYMIIAVDEESGDIHILGIYDIASSDTNGAVMAMRNLKNVKEGDKFKIIYDKDSFGSEGHTQLYGPELIYTANTKIDYEKVRDGKYLATFAMYDVRGDVFYSPVVQYEIKGGKIASIEHRRDFVQSASE